MTDKPDPMTCPACNSVEDAWELDPVDNEWGWDEEWWRDPQDPLGNDYTCSKKCYLIRKGGKW